VNWVARFLLPLVPGPVIGLVLLLAFLALRKSVPPSIDLVAAHGIGTSRAFSVSHEAGTYSSLAMGLHGIVSAVAIPLAVSHLGR
jgi:putative effector of murein hydrolase